MVKTPKLEDGKIKPFYIWRITKNILEDLKEKFPEKSTSEIIRDAILTNKDLEEDGEYTSIYVDSNIEKIINSKINRGRFINLAILEYARKVLGNKLNEDEE